MSDCIFVVIAINRLMDQNVIVVVSSVVVVAAVVAITELCRVSACSDEKD